MVHITAAVILAKDVTQLGRVSGKGNPVRRWARNQRQGARSLVGAGRVVREPLPSGDMRKVLSASENPRAEVGLLVVPVEEGNAGEESIACVWWERHLNIVGPEG